MKYRFLSLICIFLFLSGCIALPISHNRNASPEYFGKISDSITGMPIENVSVSIKSDFGDNRYSATTATNNEGFYQLVTIEKEKWYYIYFLGPFDGICSAKITFSHPEYESISYDFGPTICSANIDGACTGIKIEKNVQMVKKTLNGIF